MKPHTVPVLARGGPEQRAIDAGEIDAVIDYASSNVILLPAARRALREAASLASAAKRGAAGEVSIANALLSALPADEYQRLLPDFEPLTLKFGEVLHEQGRRIGQVYFPVDCVVCLLATAERPRALGVGLIGREGMVGASLALGAKLSCVRVLVHATGTALRMNAERFERAMRECPELQKALYRYAHAKLAFARQAVACIAFHPAEARLARWLLMISDRMLSDDFTLTQAFLASSLGVRRATVNEAAGLLQRRKLIRYSRGRISLLDRKGLVTAACGCYTACEPVAAIAAGRDSLS